MSIQGSGDWVGNRMAVAVETAGKGVIRGLEKKRLDYNYSQYIALSAPFRRMTLTAALSQSAMTTVRFSAPSPLSSPMLGTRRASLLSALRWLLLALSLTAWQAQATRTG